MSETNAARAKRWSRLFSQQMTSTQYVLCQALDELERDLSASAREALNAESYQHGRTIEQLRQARRHVQLLVSGWHAGEMLDEVSDAEAWLRETGQDAGHRASQSEGSEPAGTAPLAGYPSQAELLAKVARLERKNARHIEKWVATVPTQNLLILVLSTAVRHLRAAAVGLARDYGNGLCWCLAGSGAERAFAGLSTHEHEPACLAMAWAVHTSDVPGNAAQLDGVEGARVGATDGAGARRVGG